MESQRRSWARLADPLIVHPTAAETRHGLQLGLPIRAVVSEHVESACASFKARMPHAGGYAEAGGAAGHPPPLSFADYARHCMAMARQMAGPQGSVLDGTVGSLSSIDDGGSFPDLVPGAVVFVNGSAVSPPEAMRTALGKTKLLRAALLVACPHLSWLDGILVTDAEREGAQACLADKAGIRGRDDLLSSPGSTSLLQALTRTGDEKRKGAAQAARPPAAPQDEGAPITSAATVGPAQSDVTRSTPQKVRGQPPQDKGQRRFASPTASSQRRSQLVAAEGQQRVLKAAAGQLGAGVSTLAATRAAAVPVSRAIGGGGGTMKVVDQAAPSARGPLWQQAVEGSKVVGTPGRDTTLQSGVHGYAEASTVALALQHDSTPTPATQSEASESDSDSQPGPGLSPAALQGPTRRPAGLPSSHTPMSCKRSVPPPDAEPGSPHAVKAARGGVAFAIPTDSRAHSSRRPASPGPEQGLPTGEQPVVRTPPAPGATPATQPSPVDARGTARDLQHELLAQAGGTSHAHASTPQQAESVEDAHETQPAGVRSPVRTLPASTASQRPAQAVQGQASVHRRTMVVDAQHDASTTILGTHIPSGSPGRWEVRGKYSALHDPDLQPTVPAGKPAAMANGHAHGASPSAPGAAQRDSPAVKAVDNIGVTSGRASPMPRPRQAASRNPTTSSPTPSPRKRPDVRSTAAAQVPRSSKRSKGASSSPSRPRRTPPRHSKGLAAWASPARIAHSPKPQPVHHVSLSETQGSVDLKRFTQRRPRTPATRRSPRREPLSPAGHIHASRAHRYLQVLDRADAVLQDHRNWSKGSTASTRTQHESRSQPPQDSHASELPPSPQEHPHLPASPKADAAPSGVASPDLQTSSHAHAMKAVSDAAAAMRCMAEHLASPPRQQGRDESLPTDLGEPALPESPTKVRSPPAVSPPRALHRARAPVRPLPAGGATSPPLSVSEQGTPVQDAAAAQRDQHAEQAAKEAVPAPVESSSTRSVGVGMSPGAVQAGSTPPQGGFDHPQPLGDPLRSLSQRPDLHPVTQQPAVFPEHADIVAGIRDLRSASAALAEDGVQPRHPSGSLASEIATRPRAPLIPPLDPATDVRQPSSTTQASRVERSPSASESSDSEEHSGSGSDTSSSSGSDSEASPQSSSRPGGVPAGRSSRAAAGAPQGNAGVQYMVVPTHWPLHPAWKAPAAAPSHAATQPAAQAQQRAASPTPSMDAPPDHVSEAGHSTRSQRADVEGLQAGWAAMRERSASRAASIIAPDREARAVPSQAPIHVHVHMEGGANKAPAPAATLPSEFQEMTQTLKHLQEQRQVETAGVAAEARQARGLAEEALLAVRGLAEAHMEGALSEQEAADAEFMQSQQEELQAERLELQEAKQELARERQRQQDQWEADRREQAWQAERAELQRKADEAQAKLEAEQATLAAAILARTQHYQEGHMGGPHQPAQAATEAQVSGAGRIAAAPAGDSDVLKAAAAARAELYKSASHRATVGRVLARAPRLMSRQDASLAAAAASAVARASPPRVSDSGMQRAGAPSSPQGPAYVVRMVSGSGAASPSSSSVRPPPDPRRLRAKSSTNLQHSTAASTQPLMGTEPALDSPSEDRQAPRPQGARASSKWWHAVDSGSKPAQPEESKQGSLDSWTHPSTAPPLHRDMLVGDGRQTYSLSMDDSGDRTAPSGVGAHHSVAIVSPVALEAGSGPQPTTSRDTSPSSVVGQQVEGVLADLHSRVRSVVKHAMRTSRSSEARASPASPPRRSASRSPARSRSGRRYSGTGGGNVDMKRFVGVGPVTQHEVREADRVAAGSLPQGGASLRRGDLDAALASISARMTGLSEAGLLSPRRDTLHTERDGASLYSHDPVLTGMAGTTLRRGERTPSRGSVHASDFVSASGASTPGRAVQLKPDGMSVASGPDEQLSPQDELPAGTQQQEDDASVLSKGTVASALAAAVTQATQNAVQRILGQRSASSASQSQVERKGASSQRFLRTSGEPKKNQPTRTAQRSGSDRASAVRPTAHSRAIELATARTRAFGQAGRRSSASSRRSKGSSGSTTFAWRQKVKAAAEAARARVEAGKAVAARSSAYARQQRRRDEPLWGAAPLDTDPGLGGTILTGREDAAAAGGVLAASRAGHGSSLASTARFAGQLRGYNPMPPRAPQPAPKSGKKRARRGEPKRAPPPESLASDVRFEQDDDLASQLTEVSVFERARASRQMVDDALAQASASGHRPSLSYARQDPPPHSGPELWRVTDLGGQQGHTVQVGSGAGSMRTAASSEDVDLLHLLSHLPEQGKVGSAPTSTRSPVETSSAPAPSMTRVPAPAPAPSRLVQRALDQAQSLDDSVFAEDMEPEEHVAAAQATLGGMRSGQDSGDVMVHIQGVARDGEELDRMLAQITSDLSSST